MPLSTRRHALRWIAALALALGLVGACGGPETSVTQTWKATWAPPMKTVLVFGARMDEANRRALEDSFVAGLRSHGVVAKPSYEVFPGQPPEREKAREIVKAAGFEGLLVASLRNVREKTTYVPGSYHGGFWSSYYGPGWGYWDPGYVLTDKFVDWEMTLWDARAEDRLAWTATLETNNPSAGGEFVKSVTGTTLGLLEKQGLIPGTEK